MRRADQVYYEQICERETIACGYAYRSDRFAEVAECHFVGEVLLELCNDSLTVVDTYFTRIGRECSRWVPAADQPAAAVAELLAGRGFERRERVVFAWNGVERERPGGLRVVGARAMRRSYTRIAEARSAEGGGRADALTQLQLERLNDPQYDAFVALDGDEPVGMISLLQVGQIGRLCDLYVRKEHRRRSAARQLLHAALSAARRWALHPVVAAVEDRNEAGAGLLCGAGFAEAGRIVSFCRAGFVEVGG